MSDIHLVIVGDEIVDGAISDAHGRYVAAELRRSGAGLTSITMVRDSVNAIAETLRTLTGMDNKDAGQPARLVLMSGGLGPTRDDCTRQALAVAFDEALEFREAVWQALVERFPTLKAASNRRQAYAPSGWEILANQWGTAPGLWSGIRDGTGVAALPGPPQEFQPMVRHHLDRILCEWGHRTTPQPFVDLTTFGVSESELEDEVARAADERLTWHTRAEPDRILVRLVGERAAARLVVDRLVERFGEARVVSGEATLAALVIDELREHGLMLITAESCTGGLIGGAVTAVPGSSDVFWGALVTYANQAKERVLGIPARLLATNGAVSRECVEAMAEGARRASGATAALSVSGIAGPGGGTVAKPVGTVWLGVSIGDRGPMSLLLNLHGDRDRIRRVSVREGLLFLREQMRGVVRYA